MGGLSGISNIALGALSADEAALSVSSNNISNVNTPGYSSETAVLAENPTVNIGNQVFGTGVTLESIQSSRDNILDTRIADENGQQTQSQGYLNAMNQVQAMFNDDSGTGLQSVLSSFFNSFSNLSTDPSSSSLRQDVMTSAQNLAQTFNETSNNLQQIDTSLDQQAVADVSQINDVTSQIAQLNAQIADTPASGTSGSADGSDSSDMLIDQQTQLLQKLSGYVGTTVHENSNGTVNVATNNGAVLVSGNQNYALTTQPDPTTGHTQIYSAQGANVTSGLSGGDLAGTIQARDQGIAGVLSQLDTLASGIATQMNSLNTTGYDQSNGAGQPGALGQDFFVAPTSTSGYAATMALNITSSSQIAAGTTTASGDNTNALKMAALENDSVVDGQTPVNYYSNMVSVLGNQVSQATTENTAQGDVLTQLQQQQSNESGVSLDEEAVNIIQYQRAYEASARVISVVESIMDDAINLGTSGATS